MLRASGQETRALALPAPTLQDLGQVPFSKCHLLELKNLGTSQEVVWALEMDLKHVYKKLDPPFFQPWGESSTGWIY